MTAKYRLKYWICLAINLLLNVCPLFIYTITALVESNLVYEKVTLTATVFIVFIMTLISWINKITLRSRLWIILIGVYICLNEILTPLIIIAICQIIDEILICPLKNHYKTRLVINKELDKRL